MKVLVLVLSCKKPPYDELYETQRQTWDSVEVKNVETVYYLCDSIEEMPGRLRRALDGVNAQYDWDFLFRTNSSSYVDKCRLYELVKTIPRQRCYLGVDGGGFVSGSGMLLSRDVVYILRRDLPDISPIVEDVIVGQILRRWGITITPGWRYDYWHEEFLAKFYGPNPLAQKCLLDAYHVRCKCDEDRERDALAMKAVHQIKLSLP